MDGRVEDGMTEQAGGRSRVSAAGGSCALEFDRAAGTFELTSGDTVLLGGARVAAVARGGRKGEALSAVGPWEESGVPPAGGGGDLELFSRAAWGRLLFSARALGEGIVTRVGVSWESPDDPPGLEALYPLLAPPGSLFPGRESNRGWRVYVNGWQCWTPSGTLVARRPGDALFPLFLPRFLKPMLANTATPVTSERGAFSSEWFSAVADTGRGDSLVVGFTGLRRFLSQVSFRLGRRPGESRADAACRPEGRRPARGEVLWSEPLALIPGDLSGRNLEAYCEMTAEAQGAGRPRRSPAGWSSWYQYFRKVRASDIASNLELLSTRHADLGIELVQIDDGYQAEVGDWLETSEGFEGDMRDLAAEISGRGKVPGVWVAPFTVTRKSRVFREKREWLAAGRRGRPLLAGVSPDWGGRYYGLDLSRPDVLEHIRHVFETLHSWGYRFFKLDFLATGLLESPGRPDGPTRAEAARRALEIIRRAVGPDSMLLAAGGPVLLGTGILDAQRVGPDVAPSWRPRYQAFIRDRATPGARNCLVNAFTRAFMNDRLFEADPDCLLLRPGTRLNPTETRTLASVLAVFGGSFLISDDLALWGPEQEGLAARLLPHVRSRPRCPDLWLREVPRYLVSELEDPSSRYHLLVAVNWSPAARALEVGLAEAGVPAGRYHAFEHWTGGYLGETSGKVSLGRLAPHGCAVVRLTPAADRPALLGSDVNVTQGAAELASFEAGPERVAMEITSPAKVRATVCLSFPGAGELRAVSPAGARVRRIGMTVYEVAFELDRRARVEIERA